MSERVYIAGKMTGVAEYNAPAFIKAEQWLRAQPTVDNVFNPAQADIAAGFDPFGKTGNESKAELAELGFDLRKALEADLSWIASTATQLAVLPGWEESKGVAAEMALARALGIPIRYFNKALDRVDDHYAVAKPRLIGIGGHLAAGKDAAADYLVEKHGFVKLNMSEPLLEAAIVLNPWIPINAHDGPNGTSNGTFIRFVNLVKTSGYTEAKKNPEVRRFLQQLGTEVGRKMIDEDVWVDIALEKIEALMARGFSVVITGIRFPNELDMIGYARGETWWVERPGHEPSESAIAHASEASLERFDFNVFLRNEGTLDDLYHNVDTVLGNTERKAS